MRRALVEALAKERLSSRAHSAHFDADSCVRNFEGALSNVQRLDLQAAAGMLPRRQAGVKKRAPSVNIALRAEPPVRRCCVTSLRGAERCAR
jgi:hypothetical protein